MAIQSLELPAEVCVRNMAAALTAPCTTPIPMLGIPPRFCSFPVRPAYYSTNGLFCPGSLERCHCVIVDRTKKQRVALLRFRVISTSTAKSHTNKPFQLVKILDAYHL